MKYNNIYKNTTENITENTTENNTSTENFIKLANNLPLELIKHIEEFIPLSNMIFVKKTIYLKHHSLVKSLIKPYNYELYIRDVIINDNYFVLEQLLIENFSKWVRMAKYYHRSTHCINYYNFLQHFAFDNYSTKCYDLMSDYLLKSCKNK